jgi:hypothetical protein
MVNKLKTQAEELARLAKEKDKDKKNQKTFKMSKQIKLVLEENFQRMEASLKRGEISYKEFVSYSDLSKKALYASLFKLSMKT